MNPSMSAHSYLEDDSVQHSLEPRVNNTTIAQLRSLANSTKNAFHFTCQRNMCRSDASLECWYRGDLTTVGEYCAEIKDILAWTKESDVSNTFTIVRLNDDYSYKTIVRVVGDKYARFCLSQDAMHYIHQEGSTVSAYNVETNQLMFQKTFDNHVIITFVGNNYVAVLYDSSMLLYDIVDGVQYGPIGKAAYTFRNTRVYRQGFDVFVTYITDHGAQQNLQIVNLTSGKRTRIKPQMGEKIIYVHPKGKYIVMRHKLGEFEDRNVQLDFFQRQDNGEYVITPHSIVINDALLNIGFNADGTRMFIRQRWIGLTTFAITLDEPVTQIATMELSPEYGYISDVQFMRNGKDVVFLCHVMTDEEARTTEKRIMIARMNGDESTLVNVVAQNEAIDYVGCG